MQLNDSDSQDENKEPPFKLTVLEYEEVAARHEHSLKQLELVQSALDTWENSKSLAQRIERECEQMTLRLQFGRHERTRCSATKAGI